MGTCRGHMYLDYICNMPHIYLYRGGRRKLFVLDLGADTSVMDIETAEYWGLLDEVEPIAGEGAAGLQGVKGHLLIDLYTDDDLLLPLNHFTVAECLFSVIGLDFFFGHQCTIVLHPEDPVIFFYEPHPECTAVMNEYFSDDQPRILVNLDVNNRLTQVQLDTSFTGFIAGCVEDAEDFGLELEDLDDPVTFIGVTQDLQSRRGCDGVSIQFENTEKQGKFHLIENQPLLYPLVGMQFLKGVNLYFIGSSERIGFGFQFPEDENT